MQLLKASLELVSQRSIETHDRPEQRHQHADAPLKRTAVVYAVPRNADIYGPGVHDYFVRCSVCGWWSLPFVRRPLKSECRCQACESVKSGRDNFALFVSTAVYGCHPVSVVEFDEPIVRSVVAGV